MGQALAAALSVSLSFTTLRTRPERTCKQQERAAAKCGVGSSALCDLGHVTQLCLRFLSRDSNVCPMGLRGPLGQHRSIWRLSRPRAMYRHSGAHPSREPSEREGQGVRSSRVFPPGKSRSDRVLCFCTSSHCSWHRFRDPLYGPHPSPRWQERDGTKAQP